MKPWKDMSNLEKEIVLFVIIFGIIAALCFLILPPHTRF
jgi:hypothetical protein